MDIVSNEDINSLRLAVMIREYDFCGYIIFVTSRIEFSLQTFKYKLKALDYIYKNENVKERLYETLDAAVKEYEKISLNNDKKILIKSGSNFFNIRLKDIIYFETSDVGHKIVARTLNGRIEFYGTLKEILNKLDERFYQCHRSYIVNIDYIKQICTSKKSMYIIMENEGKCLLSRRCAKRLIQYIQKSN